MKSWWQGLNGREKRLVLIAGLLLGVVLLWMLIGKPLVNYHRTVQQDLEEAQSINQQMQQQRTEIQALRGNAASGMPAAMNGGSLHSSVITILKRYQLDGAGTSTEEKDKDTVILKLEGKPFNPLAQCLAQLETEYAAHATSMSLKPGKATGTVDAQITLQR